jgi:hypothetical protein
MSAPLLHRLAKSTVHAWWILLLIALALLWVATGRRIARVDAVTNLPPWSVDAPQRDAASPSGFAHGQRRLIVPGHHNASFWWIMEAQQSAAQGRLRLRHIDYDAPPDGRDIRRTAPYRWWLVAVGWLHGIIDGEPLGYAIGRGALIADPMLLALLLAAGAVYSARYIGPFSAMGFVVGGISLFPLAANFRPGAPDPHSLAWVLALGSLLPLLASPRKVGRRRRIHFVVAGIIGGLGFWNDATSQAPVLLAISLAAVGYELVRSRGPLESPPMPSSWRAWAFAGALTTLGANIFEFAPHDFSWSLDSVNPIHAVAWWGVGEVLHAAEIWSREGRRAFGRRGLALVGIAGAAIAAWPVVGILTGSGAILATDFYARELANHPHGGIASDLGAWLRRSGGESAKWATLLPCLLGFVLILRIMLGKIGREERGRLVFILIATLFVVVLAFIQLRWWNLFDVFALAGLTLLFAKSETADIRSHWGDLGTVLLFLPGLIVGFPRPADGNAATDLHPQETQALVERDFSHWLVKRSGPEPNILFSTPVFSGATAFYGGFKVVNSTDGENKTGYLTAVRIASADTPQEVSILLNSRGVTHIALPLWDPMLDELVRIGMNLPVGQALPPGAFAVALRNWGVPTWMRPMDYVIPNQPGFRGLEVRAFALQADQAPDLSLSRLTDFFLERDQLKEAQAAMASLKAYPRSVYALGAIANVDLALRDHADLAKSLETLIPYLSRRWARNLPADRRISLAALFVQTNHVDLARDQVSTCFANLDVKTLHTLTTGALVQLVVLSRSLNISFPDQALEATALGLIPPGVRVSLMQK